MTGATLRTDGGGAGDEPAEPLGRDNPLTEGLGEERQAPPLAMVVFGASGDLTARKLLPALA
ncbi:MAG: hypothetical protein ACRDZQ_16600, partial [Acidimicrobiales bacterium]